MHVFCRSEQRLLVRDLEPNTKYEFAVRLHLDQLSSPWSPVVYRSTFPKGENAETSYSPINFFISSCTKTNIPMLKLFGVHFVFSFSPPSSHATSFQHQSDSNWRRHRTCFMEAPRWTQRTCDTLHNPVCLQKWLDSWGVAGDGKGR